MLVRKGMVSEANARGKATRYADRDPATWTVKVQVEVDMLGTRMFQHRWIDGTRFPGSPSSGMCASFKRAFTEPHVVMMSKQSVSSNAC